jgi:predicted DNA-binding transcriptional regulator YafY
VQLAVLGGRRLRLRYHAAGRPEPGDYEVDPVGLVVKAGVWYLVAYRDEEPRMFRVSRIREAEGGEPARLPPDAPPLAELWDRMRSRFEHPGGGVTVVVSVPRARAGRVLGFASFQLTDRPARRPHPERPDQEVLELAFRSVEHAWYALAPLADDVEVLEPDEVREELVRVAEATLRRYRGR